MINLIFEIGILRSLFLLSIFAFVGFVILVVLGNLDKIFADMKLVAFMVGGTALGTGIFYFGLRWLLLKYDPLQKQSSSNASGGQRLK